MVFWGALYVGILGGVLGGALGILSLWFLLVAWKSLVVGDVVAGNHQHPSIQNYS